MPFGSIAQDIPLDQAGMVGGPTPAAAAPLSFFDQVKLGWKQDAARPDWGFNSVNWRESAISEINDALRKKGVQPADVHDVGGTVKPGDTYESAENRLYVQLLAQAARIRQTEPSFLKDYAAVFDKSGFDQLLASRRRAVLQDVGTRAPDGLGAGGFAGSIGHGSIDPINYIPIFGEGSASLSVSRRLLANGLKWGAFNVGLTAIEEPLVREHARELGIERNAHDFFSDLVGAGVGGVALGVLHEGIRLTPSAIRAGSFAAAPRRYEADKFGRALNEAVAGADMPPASPFHSFDARVARTFSNLVPESERTPDEKAALSAIERDAEVKATSPFVASPAGDDHHAQSLEAGMRAVSGEAVAQRPGVKPIARETVAAPEDVAGTRMPARELLKAKIGAVEGTGKNPASGAQYQYQFVPRTWVSLFKRRYPADTRSFEQIAALRTDPHLRDVLINDLIAENAAALRHAGFAENAGNLYLAHVLGHDRAVTVLRAGPDAKLGELLPHDYFKGNPFKATDTSASLIHWAYGKMGEKGLPEHLATPEAAAGSEVIAAAEASPSVEPATTGRFDVEALYGDAGMTDRPILRPELFGSPEEHAAAQLRFERSRDASEGFAPVMSRAEAFAPSDHFDAVRRYAAGRGTVTPEAIGEALGLSPDEVRRTVAAMQSTDPNSPYILSRGRQPKYDAMGNVTREGTEAGRVVRRPPRPIKANETMLEFLTRTNGGIADVGGDIAAMRGHDFHKGAPFRRKLIDNEGGQSIDDAFQRAIEAGYFPEHLAAAETYADLPDVRTFMEAIDEELRGRPRHAVGDLASAAEARRMVQHGEEPPEHSVPGPSKPTEAGLEPEPLVPDRERLFERVGHNYEPIVDAAHARGVTVTDDMMIDASDLIDAGEHPDAALANAIAAQTYRDLEEMGYGFGDEGQRFLDDGGFPEPRGSDGVDPADEFGGGRSASVEEAAPGGGAQLAQLAHDPAAAEFGSPIGPAAEAQADSLVHDLEMAAHGGTIREVLDRKQRLDLRLRWLGEQEKALGHAAGQEKLRAAELADEEPWLDPDYLLKTYENDPGAGVAVLEAIAEHEALSKVSYRLGEEGGEHDLTSILDEINEAQKAATEMRNCLKPKGGEE